MFNSYVKLPEGNWYITKPINVPYVQRWGWQRQHVVSDMHIFVWKLMNQTTLMFQLQPWQRHCEPKELQYRSRHPSYKTKSQPTRNISITTVHEKSNFHILPYPMNIPSIYINMAWIYHIYIFLFHIFPECSISHVHPFPAKKHAWWSSNISALHADCLFQASKD